MADYGFRGIVYKKASDRFTGYYTSIDDPTTLYVKWDETEEKFRGNVVTETHRIIAGVEPDYLISMSPRDKAVSFNTSGEMVRQYHPGKGCYCCYVDEMYAYVGGIRNDAITGNNHSILKYNIESGQIEWEYDTGGSSNAIKVDLSGNVYINGSRNQNIDATYRSVWKLNSSGVLQWAADTGYGSWGIDVDGSGNVYATSQKDVYKYNSSGTYQWDVKPLGNYTTLKGMRVKGSNIYACGTFSGSSVKRLAKLDLSGTEVWSVTGYDSYYSVDIDDSGNVYVANGSVSEHVIKYNSSGVYQWGVAESSQPGWGVGVGPNGNIWAGVTGGIEVYNTSGTHQFTCDDSLYFGQNYLNGSIINANSTHVYCASSL